MTHPRLLSAPESGLLQGASIKKPGRALRHLALALCILLPAASALAATGKANVLLSDSKATLTQTSDTAWTLAKTGAVDSAHSTVTWTITATQGATLGGHLVATGFIAVTNIGTGGATIGNIVVNLQTKVHGSGWVTQSSDIADATHGDAATTAHVVAHASSENLTTFTENAASGHLSFMDKKTNTAFSLVPQVTIPAGKTVHLLFSASFNNSVLGLAAGTPTRTEIIVTFGNHPKGGPNLTDENVDINGNGVIDPDEAKVRSVSTLIQQPVPATQAANAAVTLSDTVADIASAGTVTFSNPVFSLGATTGTVSASYDAGASGGSITNCAHATGSGITKTVGQFTFPIVAPVKLDACNTQPINAPACTPGTVGCGWKDGELTTYGQGEWAGDPNAINLLLDGDFASLYASTGGTLQIGAGFSIFFDGPTALINYLPASGVAGPLDADLVDPTSTAAGVFGGDVTALTLNVNFGDAGLLPDSSGVNFGNLSMCGFTIAGLNGTTVRQFLSISQTLLGGGTAAFAIADIDPIMQQVNAAFTTGAATSFAQDHLVNGACPTPPACTPGTVGCAWKDGDLTTYGAAAWPTDANAISILANNFGSVYSATGGTLQVGVGFSIFFTSATALIHYLPATGAPGPLDSDLVDPTTTASGALGGEVVALRLNVNFADAGLVPDPSGVNFGNLSMCGLTASSLNGLSVRQFLAGAEVVLGGGSAAFGINDIDLVIDSLNTAFSSGTATTFAQAHVVNGTCP